MKPPAETTASPHTERWWKSPGILYFLGVGQPSRIAIKIGMLAQTGANTLRQAVVRRLSQIQSSNHEAVELLGVIYYREGQYKYPTREADARERELHIRFESLRRFKPDTRGGEWFTPSDELLRLIAAESTPPEELGLPRFVCSPIHRGD